ncbi:MAG: hypothetical protein K2Q18_08910, partial [Bdellovibrionales bacterium]|nr:hypothetical protein [Bdellovibrionales bacterium]
MKARYLNLILALSFISFNALAAVWEDTEVWSVDYEKKFTEWMRSSSVRENMFTSVSSPYYGVNTDCADTAYALRAVFAYEHKLPFAIMNPSGSRDVSKTLNNRSNKFDSVGTENKRLVALITEIGDSVGTENLTRYDTFPVAIKSVVPGSLFTYKMKARFGNYIRHTYNIKDINPVGTFDVIYSTQANQQSRGNLLRRRDREFENLPQDPWGFRRFRWPEHIGKDMSVIPTELGASNEQYVLAQGMDARTFFKYVSSILATSSETPSTRLERQFSAICIEAQARIGYVNEALAYLKTTNNSCMNYQEFDAYSTPARDAALKELFLKFQQTYNETRQIPGTSAQMLSYAEVIFKAKGGTSPDLMTACPINYRTDVTIDLATLWGRIADERLS